MDSSFVILNICCTSTNLPHHHYQVWRGEHFASNQGEYNQIKAQLQSESFPPLVPGEPNRCEMSTGVEAEYLADSFFLLFKVLGGSLNRGEV